jgi:hypothetical protein
MINPTNKPLRVIAWEIALGIILVGSLIAAIWVFVTEAQLEVVL